MDPRGGANFHLSTFNDKEPGRSARPEQMNERTFSCVNWKRTNDEWVSLTSLGWGGGGDQASSFPAGAAY